MSCTVCNGHPNCPCCSEEPKMIQCADCNGSGSLYYVGDEIVEDDTIYYQVMELVPDACKIVECGFCDGTGEYEDDYEPDYDDNDD